MTEFAASSHAALRDPPISAVPDIHEGTVRAAASVPSPCFIHSSWRTGKTWFSLLFRHFPDAVWFYEPFNEILATLSPTGAVQLGPQSWESAHPTSVSYWREYIPLIRKSGGVRLFRPEMPYDWFIPAGGLGGVLRNAELKYLAFLVRYAQRRRQIPVFGFSRSLGRLRPMSRQLPGTHIVIIRNLWAQWTSYLYQRQVGNPYFIRSIFRMIANNDPFCEYLRNFYFRGNLLLEDEKPAGAAESWEQRTDQILTSLSDSDLFSLFVAIHVYLYLNARTAADLFIEFDQARERSRLPGMHDPAAAREDRVANQSG